MRCKRGEVFSREVTTVANIPTWYVQEYNTNLQMLVQQKVSRFRGAVTTGTHVGASASPVDQVGIVEMNDVLTRGAPMPNSDPPTDRRWVAPLDADVAIGCDDYSSRLE